MSATRQIRSMIEKVEAVDGFGIDLATWRETLKLALKEEETVCPIAHATITPDHRVTSAWDVLS